MKCWIYPGDAEKRERGSQNLVLTQQTLHWPLWEVVWRDAAAVDSTSDQADPAALTAHSHCRLQRKQLQNARSLPVWGHFTLSCTGKKDREEHPVTTHHSHRQPHPPRGPRRADDDNWSRKGEEHPAGSNTTDSQKRRGVWFSCSVPSPAQCLLLLSAFSCSVPPPAQCLLLHSAFSCSVPPPAQCLLLLSASSCSVPPPAQCLLLLSASSCSVPPPAQCLLLLSAFSCTVPPPAQCLLLHSASSCSVPSPAQCLLLLSASSCSVPSPAQCLLLLSAFSCTVPPPAQCLLLLSAFSCSSPSALYFYSPCKLGIESAWWHCQHYCPRQK
uniref:Uncharacterized protein n=1 Tax=Knipowitschia caucasica TaxID=637954 RepID=A0AAV2MIU1_KNICA